MNLIKIDKNTWLNWNSYLILLLPITIIFSRFLADLSIVVLAISFLLITDNKKIFENKIIILGFTLILFFSISSILSSYPLLSLKSSFLHIRFILFSLMLSYIFILVKGDFLKKLFYIFLSCYLVLFFDATFQYIYKFNIFGFTVNPIERVSSLFFDELVLGSYLAKLFPLIVFLYFYLNLNFKPYLIIYFLLHLYFTTFITGERVSFFILNLYFLFFGIFLFKNYIYKFLIMVSVILILVFTIFLSDKINARTSLKTIDKAFTSKNYTICLDTIDNLREKNQINFNNFIPNCDPILELFDKKIYYIFSVQHYNHYFAAFSIFKDNKFFGIGAKNFRRICKDDKYFLNEFSCSTHPHNYYLQLLSETGLIGFINFGIIYLIIFFLFLKTIFNRNESNRLCKSILLISVLVNFLPFIPSGSFFNNWVSILYSFPLGFLIGLYRNKIK